MLQNGFLNFFSVTKCGLYRFAKPEAQALDLKETLANLKGWAEDRNFDTTNPWDSRAHRNKTICYAHKIHFDAATGDYLLILFKGDSDKQGPLYGISINPDGSADKAIKKTEVKVNKPTIWGRPCYYWVIPDLNTVASLKFENSRCDSKMFQEWITGCINLKVPLPEYKKIETENGLVRIQFPEPTPLPAESDEQAVLADAIEASIEPLEDMSKKEEEIAIQKYKMYYKFEMTLRTISTSSAKLTELASRVTHIIKRETVSITRTDKRVGWHRLFKRFDVPFASAADETNRKVEFRVEAKPTVEEIKEIIDAHASDNNPSSWDDTGFITDKSGRIVWAESFRLSDLISVDDLGEDIIPGEHLFRKINENRARYLAPIIKDNLNPKTGTA
ncbi:MULTISPECIES: hypothetical protein [Pseudomonas syringae group]|uniref:Uncharacterized protein n=1 Tax=Pseudomonas syringae pv. actinidiae TaxID=103796 RepID=A0A7Z6UBC0_PSESF|nr:MULTISPECIES: hypothetical protein [Pseudomonas syringae group]MDU8455904.1 hypothetical protein [Pseudomonas syringae group sp. J254-4]QXW44229.1 hypothetical protein KXJ79_21545 [Pseudomonas amygdali]RMP82792.1 hypothetical protein ALQ15_01951 [Pseudomonas syringae pv. actinidiae]